jgi:hypothetical protein
MRMIMLYNLQNRAFKSLIVAIMFIRRSTAKNKDGSKRVYFQLAYLFSVIQGVKSSQSTV